MNIKNLVKVAKVAAAVVLLGPLTACVSIPAGTPIKGEVLRVETWEKAHEVHNFDMSGIDRGYAGQREGAHVLSFRTVNDIFGGSARNRFLAVVPAGTNQVPSEGQFVEVSSGNGATVPNLLIRILPENCGWRGSFRRQEVDCD